MKKILPMTVPDVKAYAKHAHIFSLLGAQSKLYIPWIYNYYVQLSVPQDPRTFPLDYLIPSIFTFAPNLFVSRIERTVAFNVKDGILNFIKYQIENGYYIYTYFAVNRIASYLCKEFHVHDPLIYGYDDEKEEIYFADTYKFGYYAHGVATYDEIVAAAGAEDEWGDWGLTDWTLDVVCMKYKDLGVIFEFSKPTYITLLEDYLEQRNSYEIHWGVVGWRKGTKKKYYYGLGIYEFLQNHLLWAKENRRKLDARGFYVIGEHKQIMEKTLVYLLGEDWKTEYPKEAELLNTVIEKTSIMLNLCLKYNITLNDNILDKISAFGTELVDMEKGLLIKLIGILGRD